MRNQGTPLGDVAPLHLLVEFSPSVILDPKSLHVVLHPVTEKRNKHNDQSAIL